MSCLLGVHLSALAMPADVAVPAPVPEKLEEALDALNTRSAITFTESPLETMPERSTIPLPLNLEWALSLQPADLLLLDSGLQEPSPVLPGLGTVPMSALDSESLGAVSDEDATASKPRFGVSQREWIGSRFALGGSTVNQGTDRRGRINLSAGSLASSSDYLSFNYKRSLETRDNARSQGFGLGYSFPWRSNDFRIQADRSEYENSVVGTERKYDVSGNNLTFDFTGSRTLFSGDNTRFDSEFGLSVSDNRHSVDEVDGYTSRRRLSVVDLTGKIEHYFGVDTRLYTRLTARRGVGMPGVSAQDWSTDPRFRKYDVYSSITKPAWRWTWGITGRYQYSPDELPYSERMTVVSSSMNSGFDGEYMSGIQGGWLRLDAGSPRIPVSLLASLYSSVRISLLKGWLPATERQAYNHGSASAAELTFLLEGDGLDAGLRIGQMLESSSDRSRSIPHISVNASVDL